MFGEKINFKFIVLLLPFFLPWLFIKIKAFYINQITFSSFELYYISMFINFLMKFTFKIFIDLYVYIK